MVKRLFLAAAAATLALAVSSCVTTTYYGPDSHVDYRIGDNPKSSTQTAALSGDSKAPLAGTYDEEFTYDEQGNIIKVKQTEYFDQLGSQKKFVIWETENKVMGGNLVPWRLSVNGIPFCEVTYDLLTVAGKGAVTEDISERTLKRTISSLLSRTESDSWSISLDNYGVSFRSDGKFVKDVRRYTDSGTYVESALTLGWDNIVLTSFHFSREKMAEGFRKSFTGYNMAADMLLSLYKGNNVDYTYQWEAIADKICQTRMGYQSAVLKLEVSQEYNADGKRTKETWVASDPRDAKAVPSTIFEQTLAY